MAVCALRRGLRPGRPVPAVASCGLAVLVATACAAPSPEHSGEPTAPRIKVLTSAPPSLNGDIFLTPHGGGYPSGPEIISPTGTVIWFHPLPAGQTATDFRTQDYRGRPVLTWSQFGGRGNTLTWTDYIYSDRYRRIAAVRAGDGYATDYHEFLITP